MTLLTANLPLYLVLNPFEKIQKHADFNVMSLQQLLRFFADWMAGRDPSLSISQPQKAAMLSPFTVRISTQSCGRFNIDKNVSRTPHHTELKLRRTLTPAPSKASPGRSGGENLRRAGRPLRQGARPAPCCKWKSAEHEQDSEGKVAECDSHQRVCEYLHHGRRTGLIS